MIMAQFECAAILFDLDGVLVDSTRSVERQWRTWAREQKLGEEKVMAIAHGVRTIEVIRAIAPHLDAEAEARKLEAREAEDHDGVVLMPGAVDLVNALPKSRWGVVTSGTRRLASARLQLAGIPAPTALVTAEDVAHGKPDPEPYLKGAESLRVAPSKRLVIEDATDGLRSAHSAGMRAIGLASTYSTDKLCEADVVIQSLKQTMVALENGRMHVKISKQ